MLATIRKIDGRLVRPVSLPPLQKAAIRSVISVNDVKLIKAAAAGGEGSKGGKVTGHTKSGKPIYGKPGDKKDKKKKDDKESPGGKARVAVLKTIRGHLGDFVKNIVSSITEAMGAGLKGGGAEEVGAGAQKTATGLANIKKQYKQPEQGKADAGKKLKKATVRVVGNDGSVRLLRKACKPPLVAVQQRVKRKTGTHWQTFCMKPPDAKKVNKKASPAKKSATENKTSPVLTGIIKISKEQLIEKVNDAIESVDGFDVWEREYPHMGIRFEYKKREVGDVIDEYSKDNPERQDERDFPDYGTQEYKALPDLEGISTYSIDDWKSVVIKRSDAYVGNYLYLIGGHNASEGPDDGELVIEDGKVLAVITSSNQNELKKAEQTWSGFPLQRRMKFRGLDISVENDAGSVRSGKDADGHEWKTDMELPYGYIRRTEGMDLEKLDCFVGPNEEAPNVTLIQIKDPATETPDEDKAMLGFNSEEEAVRAWAKHYDDPYKYFQGARTMDFERFKREHVFHKNQRMRPETMLFKAGRRVVLLKASGEGTRGGKVIGHTRSGRPIYAISGTGASARNVIRDRLKQMYGKSNDHEILSKHNEEMAEHYERRTKFLASIRENNADRLKQHTEKAAKTTGAESKEHAEQAAMTATESVRLKKEHASATERLDRHKKLATEHMSEAVRLGREVDDHAAALDEHRGDNLASSYHSRAIITGDIQNTPGSIKSKKEKALTKRSGKMEGMIRSFKPEAAIRKQLGKAENITGVYIAGRYVVLNKAGCKPPLVAVQRSVNRKGKKHWQQYCIKDPHAPPKEKKKVDGKIVVGPSASSDADFKEYRKLQESVQNTVAELSSTFDVDYDPIKNRAVREDGNEKARLKKDRYSAGDPVSPDKLKEMLDGFNAQERWDLRRFQDLHKKLQGPQLPGMPAEPPARIVKPKSVTLSKQKEKLINLSVLGKITEFTKPDGTVHRVVKFDAGQLDPRFGTVLPRAAYHLFTRTPNQKIFKEAGSAGSVEAFRDTLAGTTKKVIQEDKASAEPDNKIDAAVKNIKAGDTRQEITRKLKQAGASPEQAMNILDAREKDQGAPKKDMKAKKAFGGWAQFAVHSFYTPEAISDGAMVVLTESALPNVMKKWKGVYPSNSDYSDSPGATKEETNAKISRYIPLTIPGPDHVPVKRITRLKNGTVQASYDGGTVNLSGKRYDAIHSVTAFDDVYVHPDTSSGKNTAIFIKNGIPVAALAPLKD